MSMLTYRRDFSALGGLQAPKTLEYSLLGGGDGETRIRLAERTEDGAERTSVTALRGNSAAAEDLLTYLYENAVPFDQGADVIADAWAVLGGVQGERYGGICDPAAHRG